MVLTHNKNLLNFSHITTNKSKFLTLDHLLSIGNSEPFHPEVLFLGSEVFIRLSRKSGNYLEWKVEREGNICFHQVELYSFWIQDLPSKICSAYSQHPTVSPVMPKRWMIAQALTFHSQAVHSYTKTWLGLWQEVWACLGLEGGWDGNRWWFGRVGLNTRISVLMSWPPSR